MKVHEILNMIQFSEGTRNTVVIYRRYLGIGMFKEEDVDCWFRLFELLENDVKDYDDCWFHCQSEKPCHELKIWIQ